MATKSSLTMAQLMDLALVPQREVTIKSFTKVVETVPTKKGGTREVTKLVPTTRIVVRKRNTNHKHIAEVMGRISRMRGLRTHYTEGYINSHVRFRETHKARTPKVQAQVA